MYNSNSAMRMPTQAISILLLFSMWASMCFLVFTHPTGPGITSEQPVEWRSGHSFDYSVELFRFLAVLADGSEENRPYMCETNWISPSEYETSLMTISCLMPGSEGKIGQFIMVNNTVIGEIVLLDNLVVTDTIHIEYEVPIGGGFDPNDLRFVCETPGPTHVQRFLLECADTPEE
jgi:hypothetical protein